MIQFILVGIALLAACNSREDQEEAVDQTPRQDSGGGSGNGMRDAGSLPDAARDSYSKRDAGSLEPDSGRPPFLRADVNIAPGSRLAIFSNNWEAFQGFLYSLELDAPGKPIDRNDAEHPLGPDNVLRSFNNELYVIERGNGAIQVFDNDFNWLRQLVVQGDEISPTSFSGANPQDIIVLPGAEKAYVSRYDAQDDLTNDDDIWIVDPVSGEFLEGISLVDSTFDDGLRLARAGQMVFVEATGLLYVNLQDAGVAGNPFEYNANGKVVVIDTDSDEVVATVPLDGRNPWDITYSEISERVFVTCTGPYDSEIFGYNTSTDFGGIEVIDPETNTTEKGFFLADEELGGAVSELRLAAEDIGFVATGFQHVASFNPATGAVLSTAVYSGLWEFSLGDFSIHSSGELIVADQSINAIGFGDAEIGLAQTPAGLAFLEAGE